MPRPEDQGLFQQPLGLVIGFRGMKLPGLLQQGHRPLHLGQVEAAFHAVPGRVVVPGPAGGAGDEQGLSALDAALRPHGILRAAEAADKLVLGEHIPHVGTVIIDIGGTLRNADAVLADSPVDQALLHPGLQAPLVPHGHLVYGIVEGVKAGQCDIVVIFLLAFFGAENHAAQAAQRLDCAVLARLLALLQYLSVDGIGSLAQFPTGSVRRKPQKVIQALPFPVQLPHVVPDIMGLGLVQHLLRLESVLLLPVPLLKGATNLRFRKAEGTECPHQKLQILSRQAVPLGMVQGQTVYQFLFLAALDLSGFRGFFLPGFRVKHHILDFGNMGDVFADFRFLDRIHHVPGPLGLLRRNGLRNLPGIVLRRVKGQFQQNEIVFHGLSRLAYAGIAVAADGIRHLRFAQRFRSLEFRVHFAPSLHFLGMEVQKPRLVQPEGDHDLRVPCDS